MIKPIPDGFHSLTPHIAVTDGVTAIEFYKKAFVAKENARLMTPDGKKSISLFDPTNANSWAKR